jgi:NADH-quinone oxidoreductase subunit M
MFGEVTKEANKKLKDLSLREICVLLPLVFFIVQIGVYPRPFLSRMDASVKHLLTQVESKTSRRDVKGVKMVRSVADTRHDRTGE